MVALRSMIGLPAAEISASSEPGLLGTLGRPRICLASVIATQDTKSENAEAYARGEAAAAAASQPEAGGRNRFVALSH